MPAEHPQQALTEFLRTMRAVAAAGPSPPRGPLTPGETVEHVERVVREWGAPAEIGAAAAEVVRFLRGLEAARGARGPAARVGIEGATLRRFGEWAAAELRARHPGGT